MAKTSAWGMENADFWSTSFGSADEGARGMDEGEASDLLLLSSASSILLNSIREKLGDKGYTMDEADLDIDDIGKVWEGGQTIVICFVDSTVQAKTLVYINDLLDAAPRDMILIGSADELSEVKHFISDEVIAGKFVRPVDVNEVVMTVENLLQNPVTKKKHIAVCDDDRLYQKFISRVLSPSYDVMCTGSGMELLSLVIQEKPDLILLDYEMPVADGETVLKMLRGDDATANIPVIFLTGNSDRESVLKVLALKPEGYLLKIMPGPEIKLNVDAFFRKLRHRKK